MKEKEIERLNLLKAYENKLNEKKIKYTNNHNILVFKDPAGIEHSISVN